ncbi:hypothetical protein ACFVUY_27300 [Kitasatospora sp. NPDC058063]|uniref:hypothetical protein n=1 Tax=unclassified Kitasatospora TaxID=2633591 RepID=UPI0036D90C41
MTTDLLYRLLDVDPEAGPGELLFRARGIHYQLPYLVLSALAREGVRMGEPSRAELRRAEARAEWYAELADRLRGSTGVEPIKGLHLASYYPKDLLRPQGDLDLIAPTEARLWRTVLELAAEFPVENIDVTVFGEPRHTMVTMFWPAEDPLSDPWYKVELCTAALVGDLAAVPVRPVLSAPRHVECLIALAEEGLQRSFRARDVVDVQVLSGLDFDPAATAAVVAEYRLAPEAVQLLDFADAYVGLGSLAEVRTALAEAVAVELARRELAGPEPVIVPRHGLLLRRTEPRTDWDTVRIVRFEQGDLLLTPVADYLLTDRETVGREQYDFALAALHAWDGAR